MISYFPVTSSTLSAEKLGEFIQQKYNLSKSIECKLFRAGMNHVYMVTDIKENFVFRVYTFDWRTKIEIAEELRLLIHLNENETPISFPIANNTNEYIQEFNAPEGKRFGVLFSFAEGAKSAKFTPETSFAIGLCLFSSNDLLYKYAMRQI